MAGSLALVSCDPGLYNGAVVLLQVYGVPEGQVCGMKTEVSCAYILG